MMAFLHRFKNYVQVVLNDVSIAMKNAPIHLEAKLIPKVATILEEKMERITKEMEQARNNLGKEMYQEEVSRNTMQQEKKTMVGEATLMETVVKALEITVGKTLRGVLEETVKETVEKALETTVEKTVAKTLNEWSDKVLTEMIGETLKPLLEGTLEALKTSNGRLMEEVEEAVAAAIKAMPMRVPTDMRTDTSPCPTTTSPRKPTRQRQTKVGVEETSRSAAPVKSRYVSIPS
jgi:hypothetical protein